MVKYFVDASGVYQALVDGNLLFVWYDTHWRICSTEMSIETLEDMRNDVVISYLTREEVKEITGELPWK